jgi:hypothetical protein
MDLDEQIRAKLNSMVEGSANLQSCAGCEYDCNCQAYIGYQAAILAVLDLHKPNPVPGGLGPYCELCRGGYEGCEPWPCPTVLAMAKELGIEVAP